MEKIIYRTGSPDGEIEIFVGKTTYLSPDRDARELFIQFITDGSRYDFELEEQEIQELISYLEDCKRYIKDFNKQSLEKAQTETQ